MFESSYKEHKRTQKNCRDYKSQISKNPDLRPSGENNGQIICEICPILDLASSEQEIQKHRLELHKIEKEFYCFICDQKFRVQSQKITLFYKLVRNFIRPEGVSSFSIFLA